MDLSAGQLVDRRYQVRHLLGVGGMARVYAARDERLGIDVALKVLSLPSPRIRERLVQEGRVQAALKHPNVLSVTDIVEIDGCPGLVMELVQGVSLDVLLARCPPDPAEAEALARGILAGVQAAHELGLVHRDLKPANVLVARVGDTLLPKVADFGLVKLLDDARQATRSGATMGTPRYMAPEQVRDSKTVDQRADVFSLGAVLYELFAGRPAFQGTDTFEVFQAIVDGRHGSLAVEELPPRVVELVRRSLEPDLDERLPDIGSMLAILDADGFSPPPRWRSTLLDTVSELSVRSEPAELRANNDTWSDDETGSVATLGGDGNHAPTWVRDDTPAEPSRIDGPTIGRGVRRPSWWGPAALLAVVFAGAAGWTLWQPSVEPPAFSIDGAPPVASADTQRQLDRAWAEYEANEDTLALTHVRQALDAGATDPELYLLASATELAFWDFDGFSEYVSLGAEAAGDETGPVPDLLRALDHEYQLGEDLSWSGRVFSEHLERYPDDRLAKYMFAFFMTIVPEHAPYDEAMLHELRDSRPEAVAPWVMEIELLRRQGRGEEALALTDEALARHPNSAALHAGKATYALTTGDHQLAIDEGNAALRIDPGYWHARLMAAVGALALGQREEFDRLVAPMMGEETPPEQVHRFALHIGRVLASFGRMDEGAEWWERFEDAARSEGDHTWLLIGMQDQVIEAVHDWMATDDELERRLRRLDAAVADPTFPSGTRRDAGFVSVFAHGVLDARAGRLDDARSKVERLTGQNDRLAGRLAAELAGAEGDVEALSDLDAECWVLMGRGTELFDLGELSAARAAFEKVDAICPHDHTLPFALGASGRVMVARQTGDVEAEGVAMALLREHWRDPEPDLPVLQAMAERGIELP